jgi:hypothetical protein
MCASTALFFLAANARCSALYTSWGQGPGLIQLLQCACTRHRAEGAYERLERDRTGGGPEARCPPHATPRPAVRPAARPTPQQYAGRMSWRGRDRGRVSRAGDPGPWGPGPCVGPSPRHPRAPACAGGRVAGARDGDGVPLHIAERAQALPEGLRRGRSSAPTGER